MKKIVSLVLCTLIIFCMGQSVSALNIGDIIGYALYSDIIAQINGHDIESFNLDGRTAIVAEDLRNFGFNVEWNEQKRALYITRANTTQVISYYRAPYVPEYLRGQIAYNVLQTDIKTYVNGVSIISYNIDGKTAIYIEDLKDFGGVIWDNNARKISLVLNDVKDIEECALYSNIVAQINGHDIQSYNVKEKTVVAVEDLKKYGFNVEWDNKKRSLYVTRDGKVDITSTYKVPYISSSQIGKIAYEIVDTDIAVYVNGKRVTSYNINGKNSISIQDLEEFGGIHWDGSAKKINLVLKEIIDKDKSALYSNIIAQIDGHDIESYNVKGKTVVAAEDLRNYGFNVKWNERGRAIYIERAQEKIITSAYTAPTIKTSKLGTVAYEIIDTDIAVYVNSKRVTSYNINGKNSISLEDLKPFGTINWNSSKRTLSLTLNKKKGSLGYPYSQNEKATIIYNDLKIEKAISIDCSNIIRKDHAATSLANLQGLSDVKLKSNQEWCFIDFDIKYIKNIDGGLRPLVGSDIINPNAFFTAEGEPISTYFHTYVFDAQMIPGESGKVLIGLVINSNVGDILLRVENRVEENSWIKCN